MVFGSPVLPYDHHCPAPEILTKTLLSAQVCRQECSWWWFFELDHFERKRNQVVGKSCHGGFQHRLSRRVPRPKRLFSLPQEWAEIKNLFSMILNGWRHTDDPGSRLDIPIWMILKQRKTVHISKLIHCSKIHKTGTYDFVCTATINCG